MAIFTDLRNFVALLGAGAVFEEQISRGRFLLCTARSYVNAGVDPELPFDEPEIIQRLS